MELACSGEDDSLISGIITGIVGSLSCIGNLICVIVLANRASLKTSTNCILLAMSTSDLVYSMFGMQFTAYLLFIHFCTAKIYTDWYYPLVFPYTFTLTNVAQLCTTYFTVFLSFERYLAVCKPFAASLLSSWNRAGKVCLLILTFVTIYCCPTWWAYESKPAYADDHTVQGYFIGPRLYYHADYLLYYVNLGTLLVFRLIPLTCLITFSIFIVLEVKQLTKNTSILHPAQRHTITVTRILFWIVLIFILSNTFMTIKLMLDLMNIQLEGPYFIILAHLSNYCLVIQPLSNFIIFFVLSSNFRKTLISIVWARRNQITDSSVV